jgi:hypothetical protein
MYPIVAGYGRIVVQDAIGMIDDNHGYCGIVRGAV